MEHAQGGKKSAHMRPSIPIGNRGKLKVRCLTLRLISQIGWDFNSNLSLKSGLGLCSISPLKSRFNIKSETLKFDFTLLKTNPNQFNIPRLRPRT